MSEIMLYNTMTRRKERLEPVVPGKVSMYVCGPTVYDRAHIGNARAVVVFDVLFRLLRHQYGAENVTYVRNFTDVDDKINARAAETGRSIREITDETIGWYHDDMDALGALRPSAEPRATEFIGPMVAMIETLIARGHAYVAEGHVLFSVASYAEYGTLSRRSVEDMRAGARVEVAPYKRDPMDFVLWKPSDAATPGWESPWGLGRPGWHIECSAMARALLGGAFDIHGGGVDLAFPHHENERAQSRCAHPEGEFARIWMHNGMLNVEREKMSKSLGNFFSVRELLDKGVPGEVIRFVLLSTHYRQPIDWTERKVKEAEQVLRRWIDRLKSSHLELSWVNWQSYHNKDMHAPDDRVLSALADDLNSPAAFARLHRLSEQLDFDSFNAMLGSLILLGLMPDPDRIDLLSISGFSFENDFDPVEEQLFYLLEIRKIARKNYDFARADFIRDQLTAAGVLVTDSPDGTIASRTRLFDASKLILIK